MVVGSLRTVSGNLYSLFFVLGFWLANGSIVRGDYPTPGNPKSVAGRPILSAPIDPYMSAAEEQRIFDALQRPAGVQWVATSPEYLAKELATYFPCEVDVRALEDVGLEVSAELSLHSGDAASSLGANLLEILRRSDLTFVVKGGRVILTTVESAESEENLVARIYDVSPLVVFEKDGRKIAEFRGLMDAIQTTIEPSNWEILGGPFTLYPSIVRDRALLSMTASSVVHRTIQKYLDQLNFGPEVVVGDRLSFPVEQTGGLSVGSPATRGNLTWGGMGGQMSVRDSRWQVASDAVKAAR